MKWRLCFADGDTLEVPPPMASLDAAIGGRGDLSVLLFLP